MSLDPLEQRLTGLTVDAPDAGRITSRVLSLPVQRRRRQAFRLPAVGLASIALVLLVIYFVPTADAVLAELPVAGDLLREAGLSGAGDRVTAVGAVSESSGFKLTLVGAYADSTRTVLLLRAEPAIIPGDGLLTDQFGRTYHESSGFGDARTGDLVMQFEPVAWPDALTGARITLRLTQVRSFYHEAATDQWLTGPQVAGNWTLGAILGVDEGRTLTPPAPGSAGGAGFTFTAVRATSATIQVEIDVTGATAADLDRRIPDGGKGTAVFDIHLFDTTGTEATSGYGLSETPNGAHIELLGYRFVAGAYELKISYQGAELDRMLNIP